jgi:hypothetical protein
MSAKSKEIPRLRGREHCRLRNCNEMLIRDILRKYCASKLRQHGTFLNGNSKFLKQMEITKIGLMLWRI